jgi:hypothetical protein
MGIHMKVMVIVTSRMLKKHVLSNVEGSASGVLVDLSFSRTPSRLRFATTVAPGGTQQAKLRPCWTGLFDQPSCTGVGRELDSFRQSRRGWDFI